MTAVSCRWNSLCVIVLVILCSGRLDSAFQILSHPRHLSNRLNSNIHSKFSTNYQFISKSKRANAAGLLRSAKESATQPPSTSTLQQLWTRISSGGLATKQPKQNILHSTAQSDGPSALGTAGRRSQVARRAASLLAGALLALSPLGRTARASGGFVPSDGAIKSPLSPWQGLVLWATLFVLSAVMHSAEAALTKLSVWQVKELAAAQGPRSPFASFQQNLTRYLIAILLTTTACSIYSTALFVASVSALCPSLSLGSVTAALTLLTLFFGELLPKAIAVRSSESVASRFLPAIARLAQLLRPLTWSFTALSELALGLCGVSAAPRDEDSVSEDMLRRVVDEAQRSSEGIETGEGRMIKGVLDMQDKEVGRIMRPRVEVQAIPETMTAPEILRTAVASRYSRIPVFSRDIDNIVGIVFTKDLLDYVSASSSGLNTGTKQQRTGLMKKQQQQQSGEGPAVEEDEWQSLSARSLMEPAYFVPETMSCWDALQEMKKRRTHMAVVVDEYGGTSGVVTFEDILEEVVGEIYDEDDGQEEQTDDWTILRRGDGRFQMKATAELDDVCEALDIAAQLADPSLPECSTLGGLLCALAGRIPRAGEHIDFAGYRFTVHSVQDSRRLMDVLVDRSPSASNANAAVSASNAASTSAVSTASTVSNASASNAASGSAVSGRDETDGRGGAEATNGSSDQRGGSSSSNSSSNGSSSGSGVDGEAADESEEDRDRDRADAGPADVSTVMMSSPSQQQQLQQQLQQLQQLQASQTDAQQTYSTSSSGSATADSAGDSAVSNTNTSSSGSSDSSSNNNISSSSSGNSNGSNTSSSISSSTNSGLSSSSGGPLTSRMRFDSRRNKFLVFRDGEWVDPDIL